MPVNVKNLIAETFVKLSDEKNIDKITVKDIVEACGISRQAFYYHFQDLLEVIEWSMEQAFEQLLDRSLQEDDPEIVLNDFITASENAAPFMQKLFRSQKREQVERLMARCVRSYLQELISDAERTANMPGYAGAVFNAISPALKAAMPAAQKKARRQIDVLTRAKERLMELMEEPQK